MSLRVMSLRGALVLSRNSLLFNEQFLSRKHLRLLEIASSGPVKSSGQASTREVRVATTC